MSCDRSLGPVGGIWYSCGYTGNQSAQASAAEKDSVGDIQTPACEPALARHGS